MKIDNMDALEKIKSLPDNSQDIIFADPPYALGSTVKIDKETGKPYYKEARDFMDKWEMPTEKFWEEFFVEAERVLKFGGRILLFGIDRQLMLFQYYATFANLETKQSLYWYFICNDEDTELLTKRGWVNYKNIKDTDTVLTMNTDTETSEWQSIDGTHIYDVEGLDMTRIVNRDIDQFVTPNHRVLHQSRTNNRYPFSKWKYSESYKLLGKLNPLIKLPLAFENNSGTEQYGRNLAHLLGWVFTDSWYQKDDNSVRISQSSTNKEKVDIIRQLLIDLGIQFSEYTRERQYNHKDVSKTYTEHTFYFNDETSRWLREIFPDRVPTWDLLELTLEERKALFLGMMGGDGGFKMMNDYTNIYEALKSSENFNGSFTKNAQTVEFMQALATSLGYSTSIAPNSTEVKSTLNISHKQTTGIQVAEGKLYTRKYTGQVWSITTKNSNYCIRRNGKVSFTGNSNFPKASDVSKMIDKRLGVEREVIANRKVQHSSSPNYSTTDRKGGNGAGFQDEFDDTMAASELGKKYEGHKYSISPLKQTLETVMVFQKGTKNKSTLDDIFAYEEGDETISPSIWAIDAGRVPTSESWEGKTMTNAKESAVFNSKNLNSSSSSSHDLGRYPSQLFVDEGTAEVLDEQSHEYGIHPAGSHKAATYENKSGSGWGGTIGGSVRHNPDGNVGSSKILHKIKYLQDEVDLVFYSPKVSGKERNAGLDELNYILSVDISDDILKEIEELIL